MENELTHTPEPWIFSDDELIEDNHGYLITSLKCDSRFSLNTMMANAKLIAAAPELLAALKEAKEVLLQLDHRHNGKCYNPTENDCKCTLCFIDKVLKKAE